MFPDQEIIELIIKHMDSKFSKDMTDDQKKQIGRNYMTTIIEDARQKGIQKGIQNILLKQVAKHLKMGIPQELSIEMLDITEEKYLELRAIIEEQKNDKAI